MEKLGLWRGKKYGICLEYKDDVNQSKFCFGEVCVWERGRCFDNVIVPFSLLNLFLPYFLSFLPSLSRFTVADEPSPRTNER